MITGHVRYAVAVMSAVVVCAVFILDYGNKASSSNGSSGDIGKLDTDQTTVRSTAMYAPSPFRMPQPSSSFGPFQGKWFSNTNNTQQLHQATTPRTVCPAPINVPIPCEKVTRCHKPTVTSYPCRPGTLYDVPKGWDFCDPHYRLQKKVYLMHPPRDVVNESVADEQMWNALPLGLKEAWSTAKRVKKYQRNASSLPHPGCTNYRRRAIVGFAAQYMRPFQILPFVTSAIKVWRRRVVNNQSCVDTKMHVFVTDPWRPLYLHMRALGTSEFLEDEVMAMSTEELAAHDRNGRFNASFVVFEDFAFAKNSIRAHPLYAFGNNERVEVVRINIAKWWLHEDASGREYDALLFVDTRDAVFRSDVFDAVNKFLSLHESSFDDTQQQEEYFFAVAEEFPFMTFDMSRMGMRWNMEVHSTVFSPRVTELMMSKFHLVDYNMFRLVNSGVYGGSYNAVVALVNIWAASTAAVHTETFGIDQPLLGALVYFGLRLCEYPYRVFLLSGSDCPIRHLYPDGGQDRQYEFHRLRTTQKGLFTMSTHYHEGLDKMLLDRGKKFTELTKLPLSDAAVRALEPFEINGMFNCDGEEYALIHQGDRYPAIWFWFTDWAVKKSVWWARRVGVPFDWGPPKVKNRRK